MWLAWIRKRTLIIPKKDTRAITLTFISILRGRKSKIIKGCKAFYKDCSVKSIDDCDYDITWTKERRCTIHSYIKPIIHSMMDNAIYPRKIDWIFLIRKLKIISIIDWMFIKRSFSKRCDRIGESIYLINKFETRRFPMNKSEFFPISHLLIHFHKFVIWEWK